VKWAEEQTVPAVGLFDLAELRSLYTISYRELLLSVGTTLGVLILGVLPGVLLAVALSLFWLLTVVSRPHDGVLGQSVIWRSSLRMTG
jgi:MFS superfamily sulfate permease-like transporter